jgi:hypothetical protein
MVVTNDRPTSSETCNGRSFGRTRFEYWQQPSDFQRLPQVRAQITKLEPSAFFGFCLSMHFDECSEASAVNVVDMLQIDDNPGDAGRKEIVDHCTQPAALLSEHKAPFERQKVDSIHLTLRYFQRHRLPPQGALHGFVNTSIIASGLPIPKARHLQAMQVDEIGIGVVSLADISWHILYVKSFILERSVSDVSRNNN